MAQEASTEPFASAARAAPLGKVTYEEFPCAGRRNFINWVQMVFTVSCLLVVMASITVPSWKGYGSR
jgi:hypothetical protein